MTAPDPSVSGHGRRASSGVVVLLAGPGDASNVVANFLGRRYPSLVVVMEGAQSRTHLAKRRAQRMGWATVAGQLMFILGLAGPMRVIQRTRKRAILESAGLDVTPFEPVHRVASVNDDATPALLRQLAPSVVVVSGTRIIAERVLHSVPCPFINIHAGITPQYRGVHGGYWALAEGHPDLVGTTVHLVDRGIDTGGVLERAYFTPTREDSFVTYPYLHLQAGLPALGRQVDTVLAGGELRPEPDDATAVPSRLYSHPTLWGYLAVRLRRGVR